MLSDLRPELMRVVHARPLVSPPQPAQLIGNLLGPPRSSGWPVESAHSSVLSVANAMTCDGERKYDLIVRLKSRFGITWRAVIMRAVPASKMVAQDTRVRARGTLALVVRLDACAMA